MTQYFPLKNNLVFQKKLRTSNISQNNMIIVDAAKSVGRIFFDLSLYFMQTVNCINKSKICYPMKCEADMTKSKLL
jgi:hypothetical protein